MVFLLRSVRGRVGPSPDCCRRGRSRVAPVRSGEGVRTETPSGPAVGDRQGPENLVKGDRGKVDRTGKTPVGSGVYDGTRRTCKCCLLCWFRPGPHPGSLSTPVVGPKVRPTSSCPDSPTSSPPDDRAPLPPLPPSSPPEPCRPRRPGRCESQVSRGEGRDILRRPLRARRTSG